MYNTSSTLTKKADIFSLLFQLTGKKTGYLYKNIPELSTFIKPLTINM